MPIHQTLNALDQGYAGHRDDRTTCGANQSEPSPQHQIHHGRKAGKDGDLMNVERPWIQTGGIQVSF